MARYSTYEWSGKLLKGGHSISNAIHENGLSVLWLLPGTITRWLLIFRVRQSHIRTYKVLSAHTVVVWDMLMVELLMEQIWK